MTTACCHDCGTPAPAHPAGWTIWMVEPAGERWQCPACLAKWFAELDEVEADEPTIVEVNVHARR